jgi:hypothetical protein
MPEWHSAAEQRSEGSPRPRIKKRAVKKRGMKNRGRRNGLSSFESRTASCRAGHKAVADPATVGLVIETQPSARVTGSCGPG